VFTPTRAPLDELALRVAPLAGADAAAVRRGLEADPAWFALTARQAAMARPQELAEDRNGSAAERDQAAPPPRVLLVVDQFEELFTQCAEEGQRQAFITALHAAATAGHGPDQAPAALVVLGVRADFEARCADHPQLADAVQDRYLVTAMTERQLRLAITGPAKKAGSKVDNDLAEVLLAEVRAGQPGTSGAGALPLLSHALDQAWRSRARQALTLADYERTGGIDGAVAASAQRAYDALTPGQQAAARQVFLRLTATSPDGIDTAGRATRAELTEGRSPAEAADVEAVLEAFAAQRLLTLAAGTVEISHEVLLTAWPLLRDTWLADTRADRVIRTRLHAAAAEWERHSGDPSYLYAGTLLATAAGTAARIGADPARHPPLTHTETGFLQASGRAHRRRAHRRQGLIALLAALVVGFAAATVVAVHARQQVAHRLDVVTSAQLSSQSRLIGDTSPALSKLLSVAAWRINPSSAARHAMLAAAARPGIAILPATGGVTSVAFSPDRQTLVTVDGYGNVTLWDMATKLETTALPSPAALGGVTSVAFSPDGKILATGDYNGSAVLWNAATHQPIGSPLTAHTGGVNSVAFSPDGKTLATGDNNGSAILWDVATRQQIGGPLTAHTGGVTSVAFSPNGKTLATGNNDSAVLWDVATRQQIGALTGQSAPVNSVAFSPDGKTLASGSDDGTVLLWEVATHHQIGAPLIDNQSGGVTSVAFSPDGKTLAVGTYTAGTVQLWDVATRHQIGNPLIGHTSAVLSVAFSSDGKTLASGSADRTVRFWNVAAPRPNNAESTNLVRYLCTLVGRSLTRAEWARWVPGLPYRHVCP